MVIYVQRHAFHPCSLQKHEHDTKWAFILKVVCDWKEALTKGGVS